MNTTGRNDFVLLKVAHDTQCLYFYARTKDPITPSMDAHWMMLFLSIQGNPKTGWEGFDFVVNRKVLNATTTTLERSRGGWNWQRKAEIHYRVEGNELMLAIRRADLGLTDHKKPIQLEFKWADNVLDEGDINTFTLDGDSAPNGRFKYRYREAAH